MRQQLVLVVQIHERCSRQRDEGAPAAFATIALLACGSAKLHHLIRAAVEVMHLFAEPFFYHWLVIVMLRHIVQDGRQDGFLLVLGSVLQA